MFDDKDKMLNSVFSLFYPGGVICIEYAAAFLNTEVDVLAPLMHTLEERGLIQVINGSSSCSCYGTCPDRDDCDSIRIEDARWILTSKGIEENRKIRFSEFGPVIIAER